MGLRKPQLNQQLPSLVDVTINNNNTSSNLNTSSIPSVYSASKNFSKLQQLAQAQSIKNEEQFQGLVREANEVINIHISYREHQLDRKQVIAMYKVLLNKCQDIITSSSIFTQNNLTCSRVFNDCVQFINLFVSKPNDNIYTHTLPPNKTTQLVNNLD